MKTETSRIHARIANDALYYIYAHLDTPITLETLAKRHTMSIYHFHRVFKEQTQRNFYDTLQSIRLQKAANLLIVNRGVPISHIASACGYGSHSAFIRAFSQRYGVTPTQWRSGYYEEFSRRNIEVSQYAKRTCSDFSSLEPRIEKTRTATLAYLRHRGYGRSIRHVWQRLYAYALEHDLDKARMIGIHHDNPAITPLHDCAYVAALEVPASFRAENSVSTFALPPSLCAVFHMHGVYGEVLNLIRYVYHEWLPSSGFEAKTLPPYAVYRKNHFLNAEGTFDLDFYLPVSII